jgi:dolichyl-phosphate-mannose-protein mannosyltransferase
VTRRFGRALAAVTLAGLILRAWGLAGAPLLSDDRSAGVSAVSFVERGAVGPMMWQHPRLRDLLVYGARATLGDGKLGHVLPSLVLGVLAIPLLGLLGRRLAGARAGLLAAALLAVDAVHVDYSRQAVQDVYTAFFGIAGVLLAVEHALRGKARWLVAAGVAFGLGVASKWSVAFPAAVALGWVALRAVRDPDLAPGLRAARVALGVAALVLLPAAIYAATWAPWFLAGRDLRDWFELHRLVTAELTTHAGYNPADLELPHHAALWFVRPVAFADFTFDASGSPVPYVAVTNPLVWLLVLPAVAGAAARARRAGDERLALVAALFGATYVPFLLTGRPIWVHSALAVLPFALLAVGALADRALAARHRGRRFAVAWLAGAALAAVPLYLLATGYALRIPALHAAAAAYRPALESGARAAP